MNTARYSIEANKSAREYMKLKREEAGKTDKGIFFPLIETLSLIAYVADTKFLS